MIQRRPGTPELHYHTPCTPDLPRLPRPTLTLDSNWIIRNGANWQTSTTKARQTHLKQASQSHWKKNFSHNSLLRCSNLCLPIKGPFRGRKKLLSFDFIFLALPYEVHISWPFLMNFVAQTCTKLPVNLLT